MGHEGKHLLQYEKNGQPKTRGEAFKNEQEAYWINSAVMQGNDIPGGYTQGAVDRAAELSTKKWCEDAQVSGC